MLSRRRRISLLDEPAGPIERAEHTARVMAVKLESAVEQTPEEDKRRPGAGWSKRCRARSWSPISSQDAFAITKKLAFGGDNDSSLITSLAMARDNARQVREALSTERVGIAQPALSCAYPRVTMDSIWVHSSGRACSARLWRKCMPWKASPIPP